MRPLLVLLLVLAAVGALLFAVFNLGTSPTKPTVTTTTDTAVPSPKGNGEGTQLATATDSGRKTVETATSNASGGPTPFIYQNVLTGLVQNVQGQPVAGAKVTMTLVNAGTFNFVNDIQDHSRDQTRTTDKDGRYRFTAIEPRDRYTIIVEHEQYARLSQASVAVDMEGTFEEPPITLRQGATLSGNVRDEGGGVVGGAVLVLEDFAYEGIGQDAPDRITSTSDKNGFYAFGNVAQGQKNLLVTAKGFGKQTVRGLNFTREDLVQRDVTLKVAEMICGRVVCETVGVKGAKVTAVGLAAQQSSRDDVVTDEKGEFCFESLNPGEYNVIVQAKGYRQAGRTTRVQTGTNNVTMEMFREALLAGTVVDAVTNAPIPSFRVRVRYYYGAQAPTALQSKDEYEGQSGEFSIPGCPQGDYVVEALAAGYAPGHSANFSVQPGRDVNNLAIKLVRGGSISGHIVDPEGRPISGARITTHDNDWTDDEFTRILEDFPTNTTSSEARSDAQGNFKLANLTTEVYQINVKAGGFTVFIKKDIRVGDNNETKLGDVKMSRGGSLRGTFFDASGAPLVGGTVTLSPTEGDDPRAYPGKSGPDGKFAISNVRPGRYRLSGTRPSVGNQNPFDDFQDLKNSQVDVLISENDVTTQDLHLTE